MELTVQQLADFLHCPLKYKFRWVDKIDTSITSFKKTPNKWHMTEQFDIALHHVAYGIFHQLEDGQYPSAYYVKKRWGVMWNQNRAKEQIIFDTGSRRNEHRRLERKGLKALLDLHKDFSNGPGTPILIGKGYRIKVGDHTLSGVIDLVREIRDNTDKPIIEIMDFKTDDRPTALHVKGDIEVTAASLAFQQLFGYKEQQITYYGVLSGQQTHTHRTTEDYQLLEHTVQNVATAIENQLYYPVLNHKCNECPFQKHCEKKEWFK